MLFWEEPVVSAFVRACAAALARVEIDHVHDVSVSTKHECIHLIYSCRWFFCTSCASVDEGTLFRIDRCWVYSSTVQDPRPLVSDNDQKLDRGLSFCLPCFCFCHGGTEVSKDVVYRLLERRPDHEESFPINPSEHDVEEHIGFPASAGAN